MASTTYLQQAYLAYFGRPADVSGLSFYADKTEAQVVTAFSASAESQAFFGTLNTLAQINTIYQNLFNRAAEPAGLTYWAGEINAGRLSLAQASMGILAGAQNDDKLAVTNKLAASVAFTAALNTSDEMIGYQGTSVITSARAYLASVDSTAASLTAATATATLDASVATVVAAGVSGAASTGSSFTLTTGVDSTPAANISGLFSDTAGAETWNLTDTVSGNSSNDTLTITVVGDATAGVTRAGLQTTGVENIVIKYVDGNVAQDAGGLTLATGGFTGMTKLSIKDSTIANTTALQSDTLTFTGIASGVTLDVNNNSSATDISATYATAATSGSADTLKLTVAAVSGAVTVGTGYETVAITSSGTTGRITSLTTTTATAVTLAGTGLKIDGIMDATITTFDGSTSTGAVDVYLTSGSTLTSAKGGSGAADRLAVNSLTTTTTLAGFETLLAAGAAGAYDLTNAVGVTGLGVNIGTTSSAFTNAAATQNTISVNAGAQRTTAAATTGDLAAGTIGYALKTATGLADTVNFNVSNGGTASTGTITVGALTATAVENINISVADWKAANLTLGTVAATGSATAAAITVAATATNLTLNTITITNGAATLVDTVNLSAVTGTTSSTMGGTGTLLFTGGTGVDTTTNGAVANLSTQTFNLGAGADVFTLADTGATTGNVIVDAGAGADTINAGAAYQSTGTTSKIDGGADIDTLIFTAGVTIAPVLDIANVEKIQAQATGAIVSGASVTGDTIEVTNFGATTARLSVNAAAGGTVTLANFTFTGPTANQGILLNGSTGTETLTGSLAADVIVAGAGIDTITGGLGADRITGDGGADVISLTETTSSADVVIYAALTDGSAAGALTTGADTITGFLGGTDKISVLGTTAAVSINAIAVAQTALAAFTSTATTAVNLNTIATGGAFITGATAADLTSAANVLAAVGALTNESVGEAIYLAVQNTAGTQYGVYHFVSTIADSAVAAAELKLLGIVTFTGTVVAGDFIFT